jgi:eukaryotic-like serine/threonine-protein kinase
MEPDPEIMDVDGLLGRLRETLAERTARGAIPAEEALAIAAQIAEALDTAHRQGIVHRDLKPANIKLREDGIVKLRDFGVANVTEASLPAATPVVTKTGMIVGTPAYMSPEQAKGKAVDKRADIWAFGCVVYEMLTGRTLFLGATFAETAAALMASRPALDVL